MALICLPALPPQTQQRYQTGQETPIFRALPHDRSKDGEVGSMEKMSLRIYLFIPRVCR